MNRKTELLKKILKKSRNFKAFNSDNNNFEQANLFNNSLQTANFQTKTLKQDLITMVLLFAVGCLGLFAAAAPTAENNGMIRVHIFANSDSCYDQTVKTIVKDGVMEYVGSLTADCQSSAETAAVLRSHLSEIDTIADGIAQNYGCTAQTTYGVFAYSERSWQGETMPAGNYESLKITLGKGEGHNWFCVLYPDLYPSDKMGELENSENADPSYYKQNYHKNNKNYASEKAENPKVNIRLGSFFLRLLD